MQTTNELKMKNIRVVFNMFQQKFHLEANTNRKTIDRLFQKLLRVTEQALYNMRVIGFLFTTPLLLRMPFLHFIRFLILF